MTCSERAAFQAAETCDTHSVSGCSEAVVVLGPKISLEACSDWAYGAGGIWVPRASRRAARGWLPSSMNARITADLEALKDHYKCQRSRKDGHVLEVASWEEKQTRPTRLGDSSGERATSRGPTDKDLVLGREAYRDFGLRPRAHCAFAAVSLGLCWGLFRITYNRTATIVVCQSIRRQLFASRSYQLIDPVTLSRSYKAQVSHEHAAP